MSWDDGLLGVQREIAAYTGSPLRVLAGPGTGKTFAIMRRIARLIESGARPTGILAVTFTRTGAKDLLDKLGTVGSPGADEVVARTLHALSFSVLQRNSVFEVTGRIARPLLQHEAEMLVCDLQAGFGGKRRTRSMLKAFETYWATLQYQDPGWPSDPEEQQFHRSLLEWLRFHQTMLVGELIPITLDFIKDNPLSSDAPRFDHVLADEYQDLNRADQELIELLARSGSITVVGDEDQSIYSFRFANPDGIALYADAHPLTHDETLAECRRCPSNVVSMAACLISHNPRLHSTHLRAAPDKAAGEVYVVQHPTATDEAANLAAFIDHYLAGRPEVRPGQVLVLSSRRRFGYGIRNALLSLKDANKREWSVRSFFHEEALDGAEAREGFILLTLLVDPGDRPALRAWLGLREPTTLSVPYGRLRQRCSLGGASPREALESIATGDFLVPGTEKLLSRYLELKTRLVALDEKDLNALVDSLFPEGNQGCADVREIAVAALDSVEGAAGLLAEMRTP